MAGFFSQATLEQVRQANDIVDVIGTYVPLKRSGANFMAICPFHKEKTPSFNVHPQKQIFHCFGCHKGGDVFAFVREYEGIDFPEAVRRLADRAKIVLPEERGVGPDSGARHLKEQLLEVHEQIAKRWSNVLANEAAGQIARDYLAKRGVSQEAIELFRLGCAPDAWDDTVNWARGKGFDASLVEKAGLILPRDGGSGHYDRFRGRLMFPICDEQGRVVGFSGRVLSGDEKTAKYVNSPETPIFTKSKVFFGLDKSKRAILDAGTAIVCEGQLDLIASFMAGVKNIVAPQGTAFTSDHARIIKRYANEVVLCFDSDQAGQNATVRALDSLLAAGLAIRVATVPPPHDPDSLIKAEGGAAFKAVIDKAEGFFDFLLNRLCSQNPTTTDKGRLTVLREMAEAVHKTQNAVLIDKYAQKTALQLGVSAESVRAEFSRSASGHTRITRQDEDPLEAPDEQAQPTPPSHTESWLLKLILLNDELADWAAIHLEPGWIQHSLTREIVARRLESARAQTWTSLAAFVDECAERPEMQSMITAASTQDRAIPNPEKQLADLSLKMRNQHIDQQLSELMRQINQPTTSEEQKVALLRQQAELRAMKKAPLESM